jgi:hypothetical protein
MPKRVLFAATALVIASLAGPCCAWNKPAHMLSGAIAYSELADEHRQVVARVVALMASHPQAARFEADLAGFESEAQRAQTLFMYMASWADDIRGQSAYDHPKWHYVNFPYRPLQAMGGSNEPPLDSDNVLSALAANVRVVGNPASSDADKAVALCWIFHLVGDLHQPLHVVSMFTPQLSGGDRGGNLIFVRPGPDSAPMRLHAFWDNAAAHSGEPRSLSQLAGRLTRLPRLERAALEELRDRPYTDEAAFERWAREESYPLAVRVAYQGGTLAAAFSEERAVVLSSFYVSSAKELSVRRVVLSGYRLADVLTALLLPASSA